MFGNINSKVLPECQDTKWPIGFMAVLPAHRRAPEVVREQAGDGHVGSEVFVVNDRGDVVKDEPTPETVPVDQEGRGHKTG